MTDNILSSDNPHLVITVGRQMGSGGNRIASLLAEEFGCKLLDRELLNLAAKESGFSPKVFEQLDEHRGFFRTLFHSHAPYVGEDAFYKNDLSPAGLFQFQSDAIRRAARQSRCVIVGRCADYILRDMPRLVSVFITADMPDRVQQVMRRRQCDEAKARKVIRGKESDRAAYYNYYTSKQWGAAESYDLCLNTSRLGVEETEKFIVDYIRRAAGC